MQKSTQEIEFDNRVYAIKITHSMKNQIILATDITDEKRAARLVSMGAVAAHLSHEIRNPIGSISLLTSTLLKRIDEKNRPLILEIQKAIYRVERIIKATLLFTKGVHIKAVEFKLENLEISMIRIYARNVEEDFARGVGRTDASWDAVITQLAGIKEKYVTKTMRCVSTAVTTYVAI